MGVSLSSPTCERLKTIPINSVPKGEHTTIPQTVTTVTENEYLTTDYVIDQLTVTYTVLSIIDDVIYERTSGSIVG